MKKVMVFGTFDKLHPGHLDFLRQARTYGDYLSVVIARDKNVFKFKNKIPGDGEALRKEKISELELVDKAMLGQIRNIYNVITRNKPDIICLGYDQRVDAKELKKYFKGKTHRLKPFKPEIYKTSKMV